MRNHRAADREPRVQFAILGPLDVRLADHRDPHPLALGPFKQRALLGILLCHPNTLVPVDQLIESLWDDPPRTAAKNIQVYVSHLRRVLAADGTADRILHRTKAYELRVLARDLDSLAFEELVRDGRLARRDSDSVTAAGTLRRALGLWRGPALADLVSLPALREQAGRLAERRLTAWEDCIDAELALGRHLDVLDALEELIRGNPLRERLRSQQMLALYRAGRQSESLAGYDNLRRQLAAELGLQPSPVLQRLYQAILSGHESLERPAGRAVAEAGPAVVAHRAGLPGEPDDFVGQQAVLAGLAALLAGDGHQGRVVTLSGPPGIGKTAVAARLAHRLSRRFPDGQLMVALRDDSGAPLPPGAVLAGLLDQLGVAPEEVPASEARQLGMFRGLLATRRMLLVYEDCASEAQVRRLLPGGPSAVLVTSRRYLGGLVSAHHRHLDPLPIGTALSLLASAAEERGGLDRATAERIARCCGGLPLALRIAGVRLGMLRHLSPDRFADRLERGSLVTELAVGDLSLRAALDRFWEDLDSTERAAFSGLGRLPGADFGLADYVELTGGTPDSAEHALELLAQCHAVQLLPVSGGEPRFRVLEPIRRYAAERSPAPA